MTTIAPKAIAEIEKLGFDYAAIKGTTYSINEHLAHLYPTIDLPGNDNPNHQFQILLVLGIQNPLHPDNAKVDYIYGTHVFLNKGEIVTDLRSISYNSTDGPLPTKSAIQENVLKLAAASEMVVKMASINASQQQQQPGDGLRSQRKV